MNASLVPESKNIAFSVSFADHSITLQHVVRQRGLVQSIKKPRSCRRQKCPEGLPLPSDPKVIFLGGLLVLAALAAAYVAS